LKKVRGCAPMSVVIIDAMTWPWPFRDDRAFWVWAMDEQAELDSQDEDLLLDGQAGWPLLIAAADLPQCPKQRYCAIILEDVARYVAWRAKPAELTALAAAAADARQGIRETVHEWAAYVDRLLGYVKPSGQVNRSRAERTATDLFIGPIQQHRLSGTDWLTVRITAKGRQWECISRYDRSRICIDRRTGAWRTRLLVEATDTDSPSLPGPMIKRDWTRPTERPCGPPTEIWSTYADRADRRRQVPSSG
jgi:hypothetical protein